MTYVEKFENVLTADHPLVPVFVPSSKTVQNLTTLESKTVGYCESRGLLNFPGEHLQHFTQNELAKHSDLTEKQMKIACLSLPNVLEDFSGQHSVSQNCTETLIQSWQPDPHHFLMKFFDCGKGKKAFYKIDDMNTGPEDFVLVGPWPLTDVGASRRIKEPKFSIHKIFTVLNTLYVVEAPKWETFNSSRILIYSLSHVFGNRFEFQ